MELQIDTIKRSTLDKELQFSHPSTANLYTVSFHGITIVQRRCIHWLRFEFSSRCYLLQTCPIIHVEIIKIKVKIKNRFFHEIEIFRKFFLRTSYFFYKISYYTGISNMCSTFSIFCNK